MHEVIDGLVDERVASSRSSRCSRPSSSSGFGPTRRRRPSASSPTTPRCKGGVLFVDTADKATRFIWLCDAFSIPLVYLADVPGFMIGSEVERGGIIRHGAKMVTRGLGGDGAAGLRRACARPTAPGSTRWPGRASAPTPRSRCRRPGSPSWGRRPRSTRCTPTRSRRSPTRTSARRSSRRSGRSTRRTSTWSGSQPTSSSTTVVEADELRDDLIAAAALRRAAGAALQRASTRSRAGVM